MPMLKLETATLHFELQGQGPLLLFIAGARGSGTTDFKKPAEFLSKSFSVLTYDRRGFSQSSLDGEQDYSHRLERDADDAAELIRHVVDTLRPGAAVRVFGTSSGAIVALNLLCRHHALIDKLIAHEPPLLTVLSDDDGRAEELARTHQTYDLYRAKGILPALMFFSSIHIAPNELAAFASRANEEPNPYDSGNINYWFERELLVYPFSELPWGVLEKPEVNEKLIMAVSVDGGHLPAARVAKKIAGKLGADVPLQTFPGGHLPYFTNAESFSACVEQAFVTQAE